MNIILYSIKTLKVSYHSYNWDIFIKNYYLLNFNYTNLSFRELFINIISTKIRRKPKY